MKGQSKRYLAFILVAGAVMRLVAVGQSLWLDEAIGAIAVKKYGFSQIVTTFMKADNHPPLYYLLLKLWTSNFGYSELALRMPSIVFGVGTVWLTYFISKKVVKNEKAALFASLLLASSQFHIYYSQEARMYAMAAFFAALAIYSFTLLVDRKKVKAFNWFLYSFSILAMFFTDYVPLFLLPVFWLVPIIQKKDKRWWKLFILSHIPLAIVSLLWLPIFKVQSESGKWLLTTWPAWRKVAGGATLKQAVLVWTKFATGRISLVSKKAYYLYISAASLPFIASLVRLLRSENSKLRLIWLWLILPLVLTFGASFVIPAFIYFRFTFVVPAFYILVSAGVFSFKNERVKVVLIASLVLVNLFSWLVYVGDFHQQREMWRQAVDFVEDKASENEAAVFDFPDPPAPYLWYKGDRVKALGLTDSISANEAKTVEITKSATLDLAGVYYFEYLQDLSDPRNFVVGTIERNGFVLVREYGQFWGVGKIVYWVKQ